MNIKKVLIVWGGLAFCNCVLAQSEADKAKMDQEDLVPGVAVMNGGAEIKGYLKSISSSQNGRRYDQMWDLQDNKIKFLPRDTFERYDKIKRSMYLELTPETCEKYVYDGKYEVLSLSDNAQLLSKKRVFRRFLKMGNYAVFAYYKQPTSSIIIYGKRESTPVSKVAASIKPELYCYLGGSLIPLANIELSKLITSPDVNARNTAGKYNYGRTAEENQQSIGINSVYGNLKIDKTLNIIFDENGKSKISHAIFGSSAPHGALSDSVILAMHCNLPNRFTVLGVDEPDDKTLRVATATIVNGNPTDIYDFPYEVAVRSAYVEDVTVMVQISTFDKQSGKCTSTYETLFYPNGEAVADGERSIDDLAAMYPTLLTGDMPNFRKFGTEWQFNPLYQSFFVKPKKRRLTQPIGEQQTPSLNPFSAFKNLGKDVKNAMADAVDDIREGVGLSGISHPTRTDKYAKYHKNEVQDRDAGLVINVYPDEPTKQKENADLYGYEIILTDYEANIKSQLKIDFEFSKKYVENIPILDADCNVVGHLLRFDTRAIKKQTNDVEQRSNFFVVMYDGTTPYQAVCDTRKYEKGNTFVRGAYLIDGNIYMLYMSHTKGEQDGEKEKVEKIGFMKIAPDGTTTDLAYTSTDKFNDIKNVVGKDDQRVKKARYASVGSLDEVAHLSVNDKIDMVKILRGETKMYFIGYIIRDKYATLEEKRVEGYHDVSLFAEPVVFTCNKNTMELEQITLINEDASEIERPIYVLNHNGDNFKLFSSKFIDTKTLDTYAIRSNTFEQARFNDASHILSESHITTFENGVAVNEQDINAKLIGNMPVIECADGSVYFLAVKKGTKVLSNEIRDMINETDMKYFDNLFLMDKDILYKVFYLDFIKM